MADLFDDNDDEGVEGQMEEEEEEDILDMGEETAVQDDALIMRFCPHDSSMLYPQVSFVYCFFSRW